MVLAGINPTGIANTGYYVLGRGRVYMAPINATSGLPNPYRFAANVPELSINIEVEKLQHFSSMAGLRNVDKEVIISQAVNLAITMDAVEFDNLALWLSGTTAAEASTENIGLAASTVASPGVTMYTFGTGVEAEIRGRWVDIIDVATKKRCYNISPFATVQFGASGGTNEVNLFMGSTEFTAPQYASIGNSANIDRVNGRIFFPSDFPTTNIANAVALKIYWGAAISTGTMDEIKGATQTNTKVAMKFILVNAANENEEIEFQFHQVNLKPNGDFALIGEEFAKMQFTAVAERNELADADSPYVTVRKVA